MTHDELMKRAVRWLSNTVRCSAVFGEPQAGGCREIPDAIGWKGDLSYLVECKTSVGDMYSDRRKFFRRNGDYGMGTYRYYLSLPDVVKEKHLPEKWGLLHIRKTRVYKIREAEFWSLGTVEMVRQERKLVLGLLRRYFTATAYEGMGDGYLPGSYAIRYFNSLEST